MLGNYFKSAVRNLSKHPGFTAINLIGLAVGLTVTLQIFLFVQHELSYDSFHDRPEDIYRVTLDGNFSGTKLNAPVTPAPMAAALVADFPEIEVATRIFPFTSKLMVRKGDVSFLEDKVMIVDSTFFDVLTFPFLQGSASSALNRPYTVVLTETLAKKLFGADDPLGEMFVVGDTTEYEVTGIVVDPPQNSHIKFNLLRTTVSLPNIDVQNQNWISNNNFTYLKMAPGSDPSELEAKIPEFYASYVGPQIAAAFGKPYAEVMTDGNVINYHLQSIRDVYLRSNFSIDLNPTGDIVYVYLFIAIALFILLLACINFMNLSTARASTRAMEVGIRKVVGSNRGQLIAQFLSESVVLTIVAMIVAVAAVTATTPLFNAITNLTLTASPLLQPSVLLTLFGGAIIVGIVAGSYPALYLSRFKPIAIIKAQSAGGRSKSFLRSALVVFQFTISVALLTGTFIVKDQLSYIQQKRLGFDAEYAIVVERGGQLREQSDAFKDRLRAYSGILSVGATSTIPGEIHGATPYRPEGFATEEMVLMAPMSVDHDFIEAMGIEMAEGRAFSRDFPSDSTGFIINEAGRSLTGFEAATGKKMGTFAPNGGIVDGDIIGVIRDYHFASLRQEIGALSMTLVNDPLPYLIIRATGAQISETIAFVEQTWNEFVPNQPLQYTFLDERFFALFESDQRLVRLFTSFAGFAIFLAGLGLFGLGWFVTEQRRKEIGIRKAMGASVAQILILLSRDFTKLVLIAIVLAIPIAYLAMNRWMEGFVYRTDIHVSSFVLAGVLALLIAWFTVSFQTIRAAKSDPIKSLRYE
ncbi:MAG: ABC transporter permease [Bacteroidetes bacterium]|nr:ABC transporter permease [Bacteroidota bacterium]